MVHGASAQEECLCSTLYFNLIEEQLFQRFYTPHRRAKNALYNDDCIYTPDVTVFKTDTDRPEMKCLSWEHLDAEPSVIRRGLWQRHLQK